MKERPILFSGEMVRAILEGRKTQTRRLAKVNADGYPCDSLCPYCPGDRLWVRETWSCGKVFDRTPPGQIPTVERDIPVWYAAEDGEESINRGRWRHSIHMPRWASRITLEVTGVRVERLQDISEADACAEGIMRASGVCGQTVRPGPRDHFADLWDRINNDRASWASNPWVWVVEFRRVTE